LARRNLKRTPTFNVEEGRRTTGKKAGKCRIHRVDFIK
jgi:hypothetical protein